MRRYLLHKHKQTLNSELSLLHHFAMLDLSKTAYEVATLTIKNDADLLVECGDKPVPLYLIMDKGVHLKLQIVGRQTVGDWLLNIALDDGAIIEATMADFGPYQGHVTVNGELFGVGSRLNWHLASLSRQSDAKTFSVNFHHKAKNTAANMTNFGVIEDKSKLIFTGVSHIYKGASDSATHQTARIMVFDDGCIGRADPVLAIDDNEVAASHAATVGKINEDHLFYLKSRGLSEQEARTLITYGYLKPAIGQFNDTNVQKRLLGLLEARL
jgi:hypothetical protein